MSSIIKVCAPILEFSPIIFPHIILTLIPVITLGPITVPNFRRFESMTLSFILTLMFLLSSRKLATLVPAPKLTFSHMMLSPI